MSTVTLLKRFYLPITLILFSKFTKYTLLLFYKCSAYLAVLKCIIYFAHDFFLQVKPTIVDHLPSC